MLRNKFIILFIFILLIFIVININYFLVFIGILSVLFIYYLFNQKEFFTNENVVENGHLNLNTDDNEINKYGNISTSMDIDMTEQQIQNMKFNGVSIDNSDVIEMAITRGTTLFQPDGKGFSPLRGNVETPSMFANYNTVLSGKQNVDEMLARKQQQRANINKRAIDGTVRDTRTFYDKFYKNELDENEKRVWYSSESQDIETDWNPY